MRKPDWYCMPMPDGEAGAMFDLNEVVILTDVGEVDMNTFGFRVEMRQSPEQVLRVCNRAKSSSPDDRDKAKRSVCEIHAELRKALLEK